MFGELSGLLLDILLEMVADLYVASTDNQVHLRLPSIIWCNNPGCAAFQEGATDD
jgi:hypothetical protein